MTTIKNRKDAMSLMYSIDNTYSILKMFKLYIYHIFVKVYITFTVIFLQCEF